MSSSGSLKDDTRHKEPDIDERLLQAVENARGALVVTESQRELPGPRTVKPSYLVFGTLFAGCLHDGEIRSAVDGILDDVQSTAARQLGAFCTTTYS